MSCTMIFNTAPTMTNLSLNSQNRLFSYSGIGLLIGFLVFHLIKISFVIPEACAIIFNTASLVNKFMKQRNKIVDYDTSAIKLFLTSLSLQHEPKASDVITLVKKTFFARVSYEITIYAEFFLGIDILPVLNFSDNRKEWSSDLILCV